eukprot:COSAG03_NODE_21093_length_309_cov_0.733333_1_plen_80_part_01
MGREFLCRVRPKHPYTGPYRPDEKMQRNGSRVAANSLESATSVMALARAVADECGAHLKNEDDVWLLGVRCGWLGWRERG